MHCNDGSARRNDYIRTAAVGAVSAKYGNGLGNEGLLDPLDV